MKPSYKQKKIAKLLAKEFYPQYFYIGKIKTDCIKVAYKILEIINVKIWSRHDNDGGSTIKHYKD